MSLWQYNPWRHLTTWSWSNVPGQNCFAGASATFEIPGLAPFSSELAGTDSGNQASTDFALSPDRTKVASPATPPTWARPAAVTSRSDVYLRDLTTGQTTLLSAQPDGLDGLQPSWEPAFSPLGDAVAFTSADGLGVDTDGLRDVLLHDLATHTNAVISTAAPAPSPAPRRADARQRHRPTHDRGLGPGIG